MLMSVDDMTKCDLEVLETIKMSDWTKLLNSLMS